MNTAVYEFLMEVAREGKTTTYGDVSAIAGLSVSYAGDVQRLGSLLDEIAENELTAKRPIIVAVVLRGDTAMPGRGLFKWARAKGLQKDGDDMRFFVEEVRRVHDYWRNAAAD